MIAYSKTMNESMNMFFGMALNVRNKCQPPIKYDVCGNYFAPVGTRYNEIDISMDLWTLAAQYHQKLSQIIISEEFLPTSYTYPEMNRIVESFMYPNSNIYNENIGSSNFGNIQFKSENIKILNFGFSPKDADAINLIIYHFKNELKLLFCYPMMYRTKEWMQLLVNNFLEIVSDLKN